MDFCYGAKAEGPEKDRHIFIEIEGKERRLTPKEAEFMGLQLIIFATDVRLGRSTTKEEIRQYFIKNGEPDPFPAS